MTKKRLFIEVRVKILKIPVTSLFNKHAWIFARAETQLGRMPRFPTLLPMEVHEVFPKAFILLNIQGSTSAYAYSALAVSPKLRDLVNPRKKSKGRPPIATFLHVCLRNKDKKSKPISHASKKIGKEDGQLPNSAQKKIPPSLPPRLSTAPFYLFPCFLFLSPILLRLFHLWVFVLAGSYPLYTVTRLKVRNWPVRYITWVLSFYGAIEITVIWELPPPLLSPVTKRG